MNLKNIKNNSQRNQCCHLKRVHGATEALSGPPYPPHLPRTRPNPTYPSLTEYAMFQQIQCHSTQVSILQYI